MKKNKTRKDPSKLYELSPKIKSLMVGFKCDESLPYDYKKLRKNRAEKYL
jgi:hypothetical protein